MTAQEHLDCLCRIGRLLDQAVDLADQGQEAMLGAQIAQAIHGLDAAVARSRLALAEQHDGASPGRRHGGGGR